MRKNYGNWCGVLLTTYMKVLLICLQQKHIDEEMGIGIFYDEFFCEKWEAKKM
jgi:hypothetical protein